jgi:hypothetical protein
LVQTGAEIGHVAREPPTQLNLENAEERPAGEQRRFVWCDFGIRNRQFGGMAKQPDQPVSCLMKWRRLRAGIIKDHLAQN